MNHHMVELIESKALLRLCKTRKILALFMLYQLIVSLILNRMNAKLLTIIICAFLLAPLSSGRTYAQTILTSKGQAVTLERKEGFEEYALNSIRLDLKSQEGVTIAASSSATHLVYFCPKLEYCWAFPYTDLKVKAERLDYQKVEQVLDSPEYKQYLHSPAYIETEFHSYPEHLKLGDNFKSASPTFILLSPFIIAIDNWFLALLLATLNFLSTFALIRFHLTYFESARISSIAVGGLLVFMWLIINLVLLVLIGIIKELFLSATLTAILFAGLGYICSLLLPHPSKSQDFDLTSLLSDFRKI